MSTFGPDKNCLQYRVTFALVVNYTKIQKYRTLKPPVLSDKIEWDGEVELKLTLDKKDLTEEKNFKCPPHSNPYDIKCPPLCETNVLRDVFVGESCGGGAGKSVVDFVEDGHCGPVQDCPSQLVGVGGVNKAWCVGLYNLKCEKIWNTCGVDKEVEEFFGDGGVRTINLGGIDGKSAAAVAWKVLRSVAQWKKKVASLGGKAKPCRMCEFLCCLAKGMMEGFSKDIGFGPGCNMEECDDNPGFGTSRKDCKEECAKKWAKFLFERSCDVNKVDSDTYPDIFKDEYSYTPYHCPGCCVKE